MYLGSLKNKDDLFCDECGVFGIYSNEARDLQNTVYYGLYALQHRGQESCGIAVASADKIFCNKSLGLVPEVFTAENLSKFPEADIAIGHVRYTDTIAFEDTQPLVMTGKFGKFAICFNGKLLNSAELKNKLIKGNCVFQTNSDAEIIAMLINKNSEGDFLKGVISACQELNGCYAMLIMTKDKLIGVRDKLGMRPLVIGKIMDEYVFASETCGLDAVGAVYERDIKNGEVVEISGKGINSYQLAENKTSACIFEFVYFARADSVINGCSVYESRIKAGRMLAQKFPVYADLVCGVPDSAIVAGRGYSEESNIPYVAALEKNRYVGRTFIQPNQGQREASVGIKLNPISHNVKGKRVILVDDSIVRGTTSKKIVESLRKAGAKEVHLRISSPIVKHPCYFGINIQTHNQLVGSNRTEEQINEYIGADSCKFLSIDMLLTTVKQANCNFCTGCFSGKYPVKIK